MIRGLASAWPGWAERLALHGEVLTALGLGLLTLLSRWPYRARMLCVLPVRFPALSARTGHFTPIYRVRPANATVAEAEEMVVYETAWNRWGAVRRLCGSGGRAAL